MVSDGLGTGLRQSDAHPPDAALDLLPGCRRTRHHLDDRLVLRYFAAFLGRQGAVMVSELIARLSYAWATRLTRRPRSRLAILPCGSWLGVPIHRFWSVLISPKLPVGDQLTISRIFPLLRVNGDLMHR
jgi:hypothetical protein